MNGGLKKNFPFEEYALKKKIVTHKNTTKYYNILRP